MQLQMRFEENINKQLTFQYISYVFVVWNLVSETEERSEFSEKKLQLPYNFSYYRHCNGFEHGLSIENLESE